MMKCNPHSLYYVQCLRYKITKFHNVDTKFTNFFLSKFHNFLLTMQTMKKMQTLLVILTMQTMQTMLTM